MFKYYHWPPTETTDLYHAGVIEVDPDGNFVQAYCFRNPYEGNLINTRIAMYKDGSGLFSMMDYESPYSGYVSYVQFKNGQILKQRRKYYSSEGMPTDNPALRLRDGSDLIIKLLGSPVATDPNKIEFFKLHISDTGSNCFGWDDFNTYIERFNVLPAGGNIQNVGSNDINDDGINDLSFTGKALFFCEGLEMGYGRKDRKSLKEQQIRVRFKTIINKNTLSWKLINTDLCKIINQ
jgi:hypothetical protein